MMDKTTLTFFLNYDRVTVINLIEKGDTMLAIGQLAIVSMISHLIFIGLTWRVITSLKLEPFIRKGNETEFKILLLFIAIVIGSGVSRFFLEIYQWSQDILYLF